MQIRDTPLDEVGAMCHLNCIRVTVPNNTKQKNEFYPYKSMCVVVASNETNFDPIKTRIS